MSNYYFLDNRNRIEFLGKFDNDLSAWDYADYSDTPINFVCIMEENALLNLKEKIDIILNK
jgi:hypothetical protein